MEYLRQYFWTALLLAIILVSLAIVIIFIFINICISKKGSHDLSEKLQYDDLVLREREAAWYSTQAKPNHYDGTNFQKQENQVNHKDLENEKPPLPPRDQFMSTVSVDLSYEDVEPVADYVVVEGSTPPVPKQPTVTPHYTAVETKSEDQDSEDYDDVETPTNDDSEDYDDVG